MVLGRLYIVKVAQVFIFPASSFICALTRFLGRRAFFVIYGLDQ